MTVSQETSECTTLAGTDLRMRVAAGEEPAGHLERLRRAEIERVRKLIRPGIRVLEVGGGNGFQASLIAAWGGLVRSIDLPDRPKRGRQYFPVEDFNGRRLPFGNGEFDLVFTSNVLEHVGRLQDMLQEMRRVLIPGGVAIHIVPGTAWRFWTICAHYAYLIKYALGEKDLACATAVPSAQKIAESRGVSYLIQSAIFPGPHGEFPSAVRELYFYSRRRWTKAFVDAGFEVQQVFNTELFHTGYAIFPNWSTRGRRLASRFLGSACHVFVLGSPGGKSHSQKSEPDQEQ